MILYQSEVDYENRSFQNFKLFEFPSDPMKQEGGKEVASFKLAVPLNSDDSTKWRIYFSRDLSKMLVMVIANWESESHDVSTATIYDVKD